jgi:hypothetical protein
VAECPEFGKQLHACTASTRPTAAIAILKLYDSTEPKAVTLPVKLKA